MYEPLPPFAIAVRVAVLPLHKILLLDVAINDNILGCEIRIVSVAVLPQLFVMIHE